MDRGPIKPQDRLKSIFRRSFPISDLYLPDARSAVTDNRLKTYNGTTYYYDELGNLIHRELADGEVQNYFYDLHDQLVKAEIFKKDGTKETWSYSYDALGRRIGKGRLKTSQEVSETSFPHDLSGNDLENQTRFVWDGSHLLQEIHQDGRYTYIYTDPGSYEPLAQVRDWTTEDRESRQQTRYFHCDQIGIPREMTDKDGNLLWFGNYTGWGRLKEETKVTDSAYQPFRLQNQYADRETGLHYNFFRYYEPNSGRFVNQDPIGLEGGVNFYQFGFNVTLWVDTLGLTGTPIPNKILGDSRETKALRILKDKIKGTNAKIERERYLRDCKTGKSVRDKFGSRRRVNFVIIENNFGKCYEVTGPETDKTKQMAKEKEIRKKGGICIKPKGSKELIEVSMSQIMRII